MRSVQCSQDAVRQASTHLNFMVASTTFLYSASGGMCSATASRTVFSLSFSTSRALGTTRKPTMPVSSLTPLVCKMAV